MKIYAHRGFSGKFPEGSRTAYVKAAEVGADGVECDVRLTKDGVLICFHDATTERITGKQGRVSQLTLAEMRERYDLITLSELLDFVIEKRLHLLIETKHPVAKSRRVEREVLKLLNSKEQEIKANGYLAHRYSDSGYVIKKPWRIRFSPTKLVALGYWLLKEDSALIRILKDRELFLWTVNSREDMKWAESTSSSGLITNLPDVAREVLGR
jgi:glycerophosphoryl diester phosphodiesterase